MAQQPPFPIWAPFVLFPVLWLLASTFLGILTGWYSLMRRFPDRPNEQPLLRLSKESGSMGLGVQMRQVLTLSTCASGLRVRMNRLFGPFNRPFLVPWEQLNITRKDSVWWPRVVLRFGESFGRLTIADYVANKLWRSIPERWPEQGPAPALETRARSIAIVGRQWLLRTALVSAFFLFVLRLLAPNAGNPPMAVLVLFPAIVFGFVSLFEYSRRR